MKNKSWTYSILTMVCTTVLAWTGCGGESTSQAPPPAATEAVSEAASEVLTGEEESALKDEYALEALEAIDGSNARAEAEKLAAEIDADQ